MFSSAGSVHKTTGGGFRDNYKMGRKLVGCCIQRKEKMLIYEFILNKSLVFFPSSLILLGSTYWTGKGLHIIEGISQGLLYLHKYSRLKIIHRDSKASNILPDA
ncbi:receptor protein kinase, putative [Ricinus communis]|uniref:Receptor protein kinase, putative n=1 Tax=Ricinus communis TaxID=3988 RepID=B9RQP7_RICCO|nr:receptor protein kinase, putative [Ricinus communis]